MLREARTVWTTAWDSVSGRWGLQGRLKRCIQSRKTLVATNLISRYEIKMMDNCKSKDYWMWMQQNCTKKHWKMAGWSDHISLAQTLKKKKSKYNVIIFCPWGNMIPLDAWLQQAKTGSRAWWHSAVLTAPVSTAREWHKPQSSAWSLDNRVRPHLKK